MGVTPAYAGKGASTRKAQGNAHFPGIRIQAIVYYV